MKISTVLGRFRARACHRSVTIARTARLSLAFAIVAGVIASAFLPPSQMAAAAPQPELAARQQIVVKEVKIHDDREGFLRGAGEMKWTMGIWRCKEGVPPPCSVGPGRSQNLDSGSSGGDATPIVRAGGIFNASTGDTMSINREVPGLGDVMWGGTTAPELGFAVYPGYQYVVHFEIEEDDGGCERLSANCDEYMGQVFQFVDIRGEHGLGMGTHSVRSVREDGVSPGDFTVTYEMRAMPFPDIEPLKIQVSDLPGRAEKQVCMTVVNWGPGNASPFEVTLKVNDVVPPDGRYPVAILLAKNEYLTCVLAALPTTGPYRLTAVADERRSLVEYDESNNVYEQSYQTATAPTASSDGSGMSPAPAADRTSAQPDLIVSAIRVNGRAPSGKDDCKDGKNALAVIVKNAGVAPADALVVRLAVDGDEVVEETVDGLEAGKEREVTFGDVKLKKGEHQLTATAEAKNTVAESGEDNNERSVTATCRDT